MYNNTLQPTWTDDDYVFKHEDQMLIDVYWSKSQFCMPDDLTTVGWLCNLKVANIYLFNILQNTLKILSFKNWKSEY